MLNKSAWRTLEMSDHSEEHSSEEDMFIEIPESFHSIYEKGPFTKCLICEQELFNSETQALNDSWSFHSATFYEIKKVYRRSNVIFECAICIDCGSQMLKEYSELSIKRMKEFFEQNYKNIHGFEKCHFCGFPKKLGEVNSSIMGVCFGNKLIHAPIHICENCEECLAENLSKETREANRDFMRDHIPGIPVEWQPPVVLPM